MPKQNKSKKNNNKKSKKSNDAAAAIGERIGKALGQALAVKTGNPLLPAAGKMVGGALAKRINRLVGSGDYQVSGFPVTNGLFPQSARVTSSFAGGGSRVRFREYVREVIGPASNPGSYSFVTLPIQPGMFSSFPYLSGIAGNYESYIIHGLVYEYVSTSSNYSATTALGSIMISAQMRADAQGYTTRVAIENSENCVSASPDRSMLYGVECKNSRYNTYFVRVGATITPTIAEDFGLLTVATTGLSAASQVLGELWVTYDIEFFDHKMPITSPGYSSILASGGGNGNPLGSSVSSALYLGASYCLVRSTNFILSFGGGTTSLGVPAQGFVYDLIIFWTGSAATLNSSNPTTSFDCDLSGFFDGMNGSAGFLYPNGISSLYQMWAAKVKITGPNPTITFAAGNVYPTSNSLQIVCHPIGSQGPYLTTSSY